MDEFLHTLPCGFMRLEETGRILFINQTLLGLLNYEGGDPAITDLRNLLSPPARLFCDSHIFPALKINGHVDELYLPLRNKAREDIPFLVNVDVRTVEDRPVYDAIFVRILERERFEDELLAAKKEAERASQAKDRFLAALSHELRAPLTPILLLSTVLETDLSLPESLRLQMGTMRRNAELEARMIDDLLDVTRIENGKLHLRLSDVDIHELLEHALELVTEDVRAKHINLSVSLQAEAVHVRGDSTRIQQVLWNLLKNAVKFTPDGGCITVSTAGAETGGIEVRVTDTGIGILPEDLGSIFNAFEQGSQKGQHRFGGLGMGLAISSGIVAMHQGTLRAMSEGAMRGATFVMELPTVPPPVKSVEQQQLPSANAEAPSSFARILLVEDHDSTREILAVLLTRAGHEVSVAASAREAVRIAEDALVDIVISDLGLPDRSGLELMHELKSRFGLIGIALSGYGMEQDVANSLEAGFFAHLVKPVRIDELKATLARCVVGLK